MKTENPSKYALCPSRLFDGENMVTGQGLVVENGRIRSLFPTVNPGTAEDGVPCLELDGTLVPGFIDVQVNGGGGILFNRTPDPDSLSIMTATHARYGATAMLPTVITDHFPVMEQAADAVAQALKNHTPGIIGIHFEGPAISLAKKGAHCPDRIRPLKRREMTLFMREDLGIVCVTLAPEAVSPSQIKELADNGVIVCVGHTEADFDQACRAFDLGATGVTHLFNAMSQFNSREPGVVGAAMLAGDVWCGLIVDGHHVHKDALKLALKMKTFRKLMLVTDAMAHVGSKATRLPFFDREIIRDGTRLTSTTGELAGSALDMASAVKNTIELMGLPLDQALQTASLNPAQFLGLDRTLGRLAPGFQADMTLLDDRLDVRQTWIHGKEML